MQCPNCSSDTWDNAEKVAGGWKGPLRKCKDKTCGWVQWPPKGDTKKSNGAPPVRNAPKWTWPQLSSTYRRALIVANKHIPLIIKGATAADIIAGAAVLFIAADRGGVSEPAKEQPATTQPLHERPAALDDDDESSDLPF